MTMAIRRATLHDLQWLLAQLRAFDQFFGARKTLIPPDPAHAEAILLQLMDPDVGCFFLAERVDLVDDELLPTPLGFIAGLVSRHFFNPAITTLTELFWWVDPTHRGSSAGARLLEAFTAYGQEHADWIVFTLETNSPVHPEALVRRGFVAKSQDFLLEVIRDQSA
jgi:N-acetylglutamate synthase-like GNAT family acetyltransferase